MENSNISAKVKRKFQNRNSSNSCLYFLGMMGASVHFISTSTGFLSAIFGILKALVWPAILVYEAFQFLPQ